MFWKIKYWYHFEIQKVYFWILKHIDSEKYLEIYLAISNRRITHTLILTKMLRSRIKIDDIENGP